MAMQAECSFPARRIVTIHCENGQISGAEAGSVRLSDAPMRMALPLQETTLAVALGDGGILKFSIARDTEGVPTLQPVEGRLVAWHTLQPVLTHPWHAQ